MKLADTTVLVDHARGDEAVGNYLASHDSEPITVSTLSLQELAVGEVLARDRSLPEILGHLGAFDVIDYLSSRREPVVYGGSESDNADFNYHR